MLNLIRACAKRSAFASLVARAEAPNLTGMGVEEAMAQVTLASSVDVCTPSTQTAQVDIIVKSLPMSKPQFSTMRGVKMTLYTECNRLWHFEACVPQPQHRLELDRGLPVKHAPHACQSFRLPPCMIGGMLHPAADGHDITPARSPQSPGLAKLQPRISAYQMGVLYVRTPVPTDGSDFARPSIPATQPCSKKAVRMSPKRLWIRSSQSLCVGQVSCIGVISSPTRRTPCSASGS